MTTKNNSGNRITDENLKNNLISFSKSKRHKSSFFLILIFFSMFFIFVYGAFGVNYLTSENIFDAKIVQINDHKLPYLVQVEIDKKVETEINFYLEVRYKNKNLIVGNKKIECISSRCDVDLPINKIFFDKYEIVIKGKYNGIFYKKKLEFNIKKPQLNGTIFIQKKNLIEKGVSNYSLAVKVILEKPSNIFVETYPIINNSLRFKKKIICKTKECDFKVFVHEPILLEKLYKLNVYLSKGALTSNFSFYYEEGKKVNTSIEENISQINFSWMKGEDKFNREGIGDQLKKLLRKLQTLPLIPLAPEFSDIDSIGLRDLNKEKYENKLEVEIREEYDVKTKMKRTILKKKLNVIEFENISLSDIKKISILNKSKDEFSTNILYISAKNFSKAIIKLKKSNYVNNILRCDIFKNNFCESEWVNSNLKFTQDNDFVTFSVSHFSAYVGQGVGFNYSINIINPINKTSIIVNNTQKIDINVTCLNGNCGGINVSLNILYPSSCENLKNVRPEAVSGIYSIDADGFGGNPPEERYCEMDTNGGGWTLLFQRRAHATNTQACGANFNAFLHGTCGSLSNLGHTDSYSYDLTNTLSHNQYLVMQYDSGLNIDSDDAYIINTSLDIFPNNAGVVNTGVLALCDINNTNCDTTSATIRYRGSGGYMFSCNAQANSGFYQGHFGSCPNGIVAGPLSAQFGNRNQWAETKLWSYGGGSEVYMERVFTRNSSIVGSEVKISNISGATPFWVNSSNPKNITLGINQSQIISYYLNATGVIGEKYVLYAIGITSNNSLIRGQSDDLNVSISDSISPLGNKTIPLNNILLNFNDEVFGVNVSDDSGLKSTEIYVWNSSGDIVFRKLTTLGGVFNSTTWNNKFTQNGNFTWNVLITDIGDLTSWADNNTNWTFEINFPIYTLNLFNTPITINGIKNKFFNFSVNVTCVSGNCSNSNVSLNILYPSSCENLKNVRPVVVSGIYSIDADGFGGNPPKDRYCEMDTNGGGWTLLFQRRAHATNTQACGANFNAFLHGTCGSLSNLGHTDSYSYDLTNTLSHNQYLVMQYDSGLNIDSDDAYIINTSLDIFPNNAGVVNTGVLALCDINNTNCDTTSATIRYRGSGGYMSSCNAQTNSGFYQGHFGSCPNGIIAGPLSAQFGNRNQWAETKLWGLGGGSEVYMERVFTRNSSLVESDVKISNISGTTPFWVNSINEQTISLTSGQSQIVTWQVNSTGLVSDSYLFYGEVFWTLDNENYNITSMVNVIIGDEIPPIANKISPLNGSILNNTQIFFNATATDNSNLSKATIFVWNSTGGEIFNSTILLSVQSANLSWQYNITKQGDYTWNVLVEDIGNVKAWADNNTNWSFNINLPILNINIITPLTNKTVMQNKFFKFSINLSCENNDCNNINLSLWNPEYYVSCKELNDLGILTTNGTYEIDQDGPKGPLAPKNVYCEQTTNNGGWTLLFQRRTDGTNSQACGTNFNSFLRNTCGDVYNLVANQSYSYDLDNTLFHNQYLVAQYDASLLLDSDDAYIINTSSDIFPNNGGVVNTPVSALCDINAITCDTTSATIRYRGSGGYMSSCNAQTNSGLYQGHFGSCPNGIVAGSLSAQFGNRNQWAETKLWGFGGGSEIYAERVFTRESSNYVNNKGIISLVSGTLPFWTNKTNPILINLTAGSNLIVTWYVNATGENNLSVDFFSRAFIQNDKNILVNTKNITIKIINTSKILANKTNPINDSTINEGQVEFNITINSTFQIKNATIYVWDALNNNVFVNTQNLTSNTADIFWNYNFANSGNYTWNVLVYDEYGFYVWANNNTNFTFTLNISNKPYKTNITKEIISINNNTYMVSIKLMNFDSLHNLTIVDFISSNFIGYNFTPNYLTNFSILGSKYDGEGFTWNVTLNSSENFNITYYVNGSEDYYLDKSYMFGLE